MQPKTKKGMDAKVVMLETELSEVCSALAEVKSTVKENQANLISILKKCLSKLEIRV